MHANAFVHESACAQHLGAVRAVLRVHATASGDVEVTDDV
jgi:hypothetical protein